MVKVYYIFREIDDLADFKENFFRTLLPMMLQAPGSLGVKITTMLPMSSDMSQDVKGVQMVAESIFETQVAVDQVVTSQVGQKLMETANQLPGELSIYMGEEKTYSPSHLEEHPMNRG